MQVLLGSNAFGLLVDVCNQPGALFVQAMRAGVLSMTVNLSIGLSTFMDYEQQRAEAELAKPKGAFIKVRHGRDPCIKLGEGILLPNPYGRASHVPDPSHSMLFWGGQSLPRPCRGIEYE